MVGQGNSDPCLRRGKHFAIFLESLQLLLFDFAVLMYFDAFWVS